MTSSRSCNMVWMYFRISEALDYLFIWMPLWSCLGNGCISLTVPPEFSGNCSGDFIGCPFIWRKIWIRICIYLETHVLYVIYSRYMVHDNVLLPIPVFRVLYQMGLHVSGMIYMQIICENCLSVHKNSVSSMFYIPKGRIHAKWIQENIVSCPFLDKFLSFQPCKIYCWQTYSYMETVKKRLPFYLEILLWLLIYLQLQSSDIQYIHRMTKFLEGI